MDPLAIRVAPSWTAGHTKANEEVLPVRYLLYGLRLASNRAIPGLQNGNGSLEPHVRIHLKEPTGSCAPVFSLPATIFFASECLSPEGVPIAQVGTLGTDYFGFFYGDGARFGVDREGREVWVDWPEGYAQEDAVTYLVGPVMGFVLRLRGMLPLHASAVALGENAVALMGQPGAGKSTTAAAFARLGCAVLAEDIAVLAEENGRYLVQPGYPRVNLWPESAASLFGKAEMLPLVTPTWGKHFLALDHGPYRFQKEPLPLGSIFLLGERRADSGDALIKRIPAGSAMMTLVANTYVNYLLNGEMRKREFVVLSRLLSKIPVYEVQPSADPAQIYDLCESIANASGASLNSSRAALRDAQRV